MPDHTVTVIVYINVKPGLEEQAKEALLSAVAPTRREAGCVTYNLHQSATDPTEFVFYENWASEEAFNAHSASTAEHRLKVREQLAGLVDGPARLTLWYRLG